MKNGKRNIQNIKSTTCEFMEIKYIHPTSGSCVAVPYCIVDGKWCYRQCEQNYDEEIAD